MEITWKTTLYKISYGAIFVIVLPFFLYYWSVRLDVFVHLPIPFSENSGIPSLLLLLGGILLIGGWYALFKHGNGLPMNAFPPEQFVSRGVYAVTPHPIYIGFCFIVLAAFLLLRSPGGVWVISPVVCLACIALVYGYEKEAIITHFGKREYRLLLNIPTDSDDPWISNDIISVYALVLLPWLIMYETIQFIGIPADHFSLAFNFEKQIPVVEWAELFYFSVYPMVLLFPVFLNSKSSLRKFSLQALYATGVCFLLYLVLPVTAEPRHFDGQSALGALLHFEQTVDTPACAFPSFHVIWAFICAACYGKNKSTRIVLLVWAALVSISCALTGMHSLADVAAGYFCFYSITKRRMVWQGIRIAAEKIANSWAEISIGKVRFINHGLWAAMGVLFGLTIVLFVLTPGAVLPVIVIALSSLVCAGLTCPP
jgi:protein-S-isoprenylcysteine O-methyltransferase Ste14